MKAAHWRRRRGCCTCTRTPCATASAGSPPSRAGTPPTPARGSCYRSRSPPGGLLKRTVPSNPCDARHDPEQNCRDPTNQPRKVRPIRLRRFAPNGGKVDVVIALLCPGQGSQTPGMLNEWLEIDGAGDFLGELSEAARTDLIALGTTAGAEEIKDTAVAQPLIVATSLLTAWVLGNERGPVHTWAGAAAGHSVGEFAAGAIAGVLTEAEATALVGVRGRAMAAAAGQAETGMAAVIGPDPEAASEAIVEAGLVPANVNGGGQIVAAGTRAALAAFAENPPAKTRVIPLAVAGEGNDPRSEEHTSELQSRGQLVCRLLLEKKKK